MVAFSNKLKDKKFDFVLACAYEHEENGDTRFDFYDAIGEAVEKTGKRIFLPHRNVSPDWYANTIVRTVQDVVIPRSNLVIHYAGLPSIAAEIMTAAAEDFRVPSVSIYERAREEEILEEIAIINPRRVIGFDSDEEAIRLVGKLVREFS